MPFVRFNDLNNHNHKQTSMNYNPDFKNFQELDDYLLSQNRLIIHQIWFEFNIRSRSTFKRLKPCRDSWSKCNPNLLHFIWKKPQIINLIKTYYLEFYDLFTKYPHEIQRCDMARCCILHRYGGLYVDMDYKCKKTFERVFELWNQHDIYCVETPNTFFKENISISNSLMLSYTRNHMFWKMLLLEMNKAIEKYIDSSKHIQVMYTTGPAILYKTFHIYKFRYKLGILPAEYFHPLSLVNREVEDEQQVYAIHYGLSSWCSLDSNILISIYQEYKILLFILSVLIIPQILIKI